MGVKIHFDSQKMGFRKSELLVDIHVCKASTPATITRY